MSPRAGRWLAVLAAVLLRALALSWRVEHRGRDPLANRGERPAIGALWHRNLLLAALLFRDSGIHVPVSRSEDGDLIVPVMAQLGFGTPPRGSSSRGGAAAQRAMLDLVRAGRVVVLFVDGPRGPARVAKPGVVALAGMTGEPIHPVVCAARPCLRFGSWDRMLLPLPFARVVCQYGEPFAVDPALDAGARERATTALTARLESLSVDLDAELCLR